MLRCGYPKPTYTTQSMDISGNHPSADTMLSYSFTQRLFLIVHAADEKQLCVCVFLARSMQALTTG